MKKIKWQKAHKEMFPDSSRETLKNHFPAYNFLSLQEKKHFELKVTYFLLHKRITALGELQLNDEMKLLIAAHACILITNLNLTEVYPGLKNIYVMAGSYIEKENPVNPHTGTPLHVPRLGESWKRGPIVLSWDSIEQTIKFPLKKHNLIIHEFSHHLDQQDGHFDGTPELQSDLQYHHWAQVMGKEFKILRHKVVRQAQTDIDAYGATNEAEFFAVCTEYFFTDPHHLNKKHPEIFHIYLDYFKIDPRSWNRE